MMVLSEYQSYIEVSDDSEPEFVEKMCKPLERLHNESSDNLTESPRKRFVIMDLEETEHLSTENCTMKGLFGEKISCNSHEMKVNSKTLEEERAFLDTQLPNLEYYSEEEIVGCNKSISSRENPDKKIIPTPYRLRFKGATNYNEDELEKKEFLSEKTKRALRPKCKKSLKEESDLSSSESERDQIIESEFEDYEELVEKKLNRKSVSHNESRIRSVPNFIRQNDITPCYKEMAYFNSLKSKYNCQEELFSFAGDGVLCKSKMLDIEILLLSNLPAARKLFGKCLFLFLRRIRSRSDKFNQLQYIRI